MDTSKRVLVVGAGFAGLMAGRALTGRGMAVTVLEARERVGGRVWSRTLRNGAIVELGAEWIMPGDRALLTLARGLGLEAVEAGTSYRRREPWGPVTTSLPDQEAFLDAARDALSALGAEARRGLSLGSFLDRVEGDDAARSAVKTRLSGTCAQDLERVSLAAAGEGAFRGADPAGPYRRIGDGNQRIAEVMAGSLDVRLGTGVEAIDHGPHGVVVHAGPHAETAAAAVVAVPPSIATRLRFSPALPAPLAEALRALPMGVAAKLAVATSGRPEPRSRQWTGLPMWCWAANGPGGATRPCVASFAGSPAAMEALGVTRHRASDWVGLLETMNPDLSFDGDPVMYAWADDPFTLGAYAAWDAASWDRRDRFAQAVGRVAFAGEHTAGADHHGTMEGALRSGLRAADQVTAALR